MFLWRIYKISKACKSAWCCIFLSERRSHRFILIFIIYMQVIYTMNFLAFPHLSHILALSLYHSVQKNCGSRQTFWLAFSRQTSRKTRYRGCRCSIKYRFFYPRTLSWYRWTDQCCQAWTDESRSTLDTEIIWAK